MDPLKIRVACAAGALTIGAPFALPQTYPSKPIHLTVPYVAGGTTDIVSRLIAQKVADRLGQPVLVENRPGGDTLIGTEAVSKAVPDGYTLLLSSTSGMAILAHTRKRLPYDSFKDLITGEMFKFATHTDIVHIPYKGIGPATTDLLSGQVNIMF